MDPKRYIEQDIFNLRPGDHLCSFYEDEGQHVEILARYLLNGIVRGQKVMYRSEGYHPGAGLAPFSTQRRRFEDALARGQLAVFPCQEVDPQAVLDWLADATAQAAARGCPSVRCAIEMSQLVQGETEPGRVIEFEARLGELAHAKQAILLCLYHRRKCAPTRLLDVLHCHPKVAAGDIITDNAYYIPPAGLTGEDRAGAQLDRILKNLARLPTTRDIAWRERAERKRTEQTLLEREKALLQHEISERQKVEEVLRESEGRYRALVNQAPLSIMVIQGGLFVFANPAIVQRLGYASAYELIGRNIGDLIVPEAAPEAASKAQDMLRQSKMGSAIAPAITTFRCKDGGVYYLENTSVPILYQGQPAVLLIGQDVSERLRYEQQLQASLAEKEVMLREIHHRVKNNLNVIIALIDLHKAGQQDAQALLVFRELQTRVYSMALVHESLYRSPNLARVDCAGYLRTLVSYLYSAYRPAENASGALPVSPAVEAADVTLKIETAIPCGLIVNELVTNAMKYAFPPGYICGDPGGCQITVRLERAPGPDGDENWLEGTSLLQANNLLLTVRDNGAGLPAGFDWRASPTLGLQLVQVLVRQLGGQMKLVAEHGVAWNMTFPSQRQE